MAVGGGCFMIAQWRQSLCEMGARSKLNHFAFICRETRVDAVEMYPWVG